VSFQLSEGAVLSAGDLIATMQLDNEDCVVKAELFAGNELLESEEEKHSSKVLLPHLAFNQALAQLQTVLEGYSLGEEDMVQALWTCTQAHHNKLLPAFALTEAMSVLSGRIDEDLFNNIISLKDNFVLQQDDPTVKFPSATILSAIWQKAQKMESSQKAAFLAQMGPVWDMAEVHLHSPEVRILFMLIKFTESFLSIEKLFDESSFTDTVNTLRKDHSGQLEVVWDICSSHVNLGDKKLLMLKVIAMMESIPLSVTSQRVKFPAGVPSRHDLSVRNLKARLTELARLKNSTYSQISFAANQVLTKQTTLTILQRRERLHQALVEALNVTEIVGDAERAVPLKKFVETNVAVRDLLQECMQEDNYYQLAYIELYIRHTYQKTHDLINFTSGTSISDEDASSPWVGFEFLSRKFLSIPSPTDKDGIAIPNKHHSFSDLSAISKHHFNSSGVISLTSMPSSETMVSDVEEEEGADASAALDDKRRFGLFAVVPTTDDFVRLFLKFLEKMPKQRLGPLNLAPVNALHICIKDGNFPSDADASAFLSNFLNSQEEALLKHGLRRVTVLVGNVSEHLDTNKLSSMTTEIEKINQPDNLSTFTFRCGDNFVEDQLLRHIEAPHAFHLDLPRLANFNISLEEGMLTPSGHIHLYKAIPEGQSGPVSYFSRMVSFLADIKENDTETLFIDALDLMALVKGREDVGGQKDSQPARKKKKASNHMFLNVVAPDIVFQPAFFEDEMRRICMKYAAKMVKLSINVVELKITSKLNADGNPIFIRMNFTNPTGFVVKVEQYYEELRNGSTVFCSVAGSSGEWDGLAVTTPYPISQKFDSQRADALASSDTLYAYDWPDLFEEALSAEWRAYFQARVKPGRAATSTPALPNDMFVTQELVLTDGTGKCLPKGWTVDDADDAVLVPMARPNGSNDIGMVGWLITMKTPECKTGRQMVVIANDITFAAGSFGTREDLFFLKASEFARASGLPRLYLAANSGARIGMAQSLKDKFEVCWTDAHDPSKGFQYIYLTPTVHDFLLETVAQGDISKMPVLCEERTTPEGDVRHVITDIIGVEQDLGVENLMGSGLIAGETSKAYDDIFTLTLVVGRTVGIGAYLVRLGQRTIQKKESSPIILTGFQALNKLMGQDIYTSNNQLGGPMIMSPNGVTHLLADTHMDSVCKALQWLSFIPAARFAPLPLLDTLDPIGREVSFKPKKNASYDPRFLLNGVSRISNGQEVWESGFCDRGSFVEVLGDWAKTVVVGRGRLGGIPLGIICTESRTAESFIPADPADTTSQEKIIQQAGGVWFPDSAYKTAQALRDFNREELPCIVFANWRGFSGGQRDMFDEVLKFGAMIVDAFVAYEQPLFVYIPPHAELRGGAWVVVDSTINSDVMEFYAAEDARGGVLEATGAASIKYRDKEIRQTANRVDPVLEQLNKELHACDDDVEKKIVASKIFQREKLVLGVFRQIAVHFADLHDTPGRMKAKGVIRKQVSWAQSRTFFFWRLRRKLAEFDVTRMLRDVDAVRYKSKQTAISVLKTWFCEQVGGSEDVLEKMWEDDVKVMQWLKDNTAYLRDRLRALQDSTSGQQLASLLAIAVTPAQTPSEEFMATAFAGMSKQDTEKFIAQLTEMNKARK
jgi:acetyl-CoA carboxylase/biotin carboxylase 1